MPRLVNLANYQQFVAINLTRDPGYDPINRTIPNCCEVGLVWTLADGKIGHNVLHGRTIAAPAPTQAQANAILTALTTGAPWTALATFMQVGGGLTGVRLRNIAIANQPYVPSTGAGGIGSDGTNQSLPNEVASVITLRTAEVGPHARGRIFVPGFTSLGLAPGNVMAPALVTALTNWAQTIPTALAGQGYTLCLGLHSRVAHPNAAGDTVPARAATTLDVTSLTMRDNHWDTMRRRGLK